MISRNSLLAAAGCVLITVSGAAIAVFNAGRVKHPEALDFCSEALCLLVDNPESVKIEGYSSLDSVFGRCFISPDEKPAVMERVSEYSLSCLDRLKDMDFSSAGGLGDMMPDGLDGGMKRISAVNDILMRDDATDDAPFSGYRLKVAFQAEDARGDTYKSEYWFILDKNAKHILYSFEIPKL